ncbi:MAG: primosomal protein DnaI [Culicoidibacterales bacterium]
MQRIGKSLPKGTRKIEVERELLQRLIAHEQVQQLLAKYPQISEAILYDNLPALAELVRYHHHCDVCRGLHECTHPAKGYQAYLTLDDTRLQTTLYPCHYKKQQLAKSTLIQAVSLPDDILRAKFSDWTPEEVMNSRLHQALVQCRAISDHTDFRGLYIDGEFGIGKTHLLGAIAHNLSEKNIHSLLVFWPEFTREIKSDFNVIDEKIERLKQIDVLMIDDIGAESNTSFLRDEVLLPILNYRMMFKKPTFFSSNLSLQALLQHFTISQRGDDEPIKATRVIERIHSMTIPLTIKGQNRRR